MAVSAFSLRDLFLVVFSILLSFLIWGFFYQNQSEKAIYNPDAYSFASVAKEVTQGHGFQTKSLILPQLDYLKQAGKDTAEWDSLYNFPFPVVVMALLFMILGAGDFAISFSSGLLYFLSVPLVYLIARKRFNRSVAAISSLFFILSPHILRYSISGMTELSSIFLTLLLVYLFTFEPNRFTLIFGGLAWGLFYLNRHTSLIFLPVFLTFIYQAQPEQKWRNWAYFTLPFLAMILPWLWHMYKLTGSPFFHLGASILIPNQTSLFPNFHVNLYPYYTSPLEFMLKYPGLVAVKYLKESFMINWVLFGVFLHLKKSFNHFDRLVLWLFFLVALVQPLFGNNPRYYALFAPLFLMYIIGVADSLLRKYSFAGPRLRAAFLIVLLLITSWGSLTAVWQGIRGEKAHGRGSGMVEHNLKNMGILTNILDKNRLTATNVCSEVAWYTDRKALTLPPDRDSLNQFQDKYGLSIDQIYLSVGLHMPGLTPPGWAKWEIARQTGQLEGYAVRYRFLNGSILLTRI